MFKHLSGTISYFKIHCKVLYWARVPEGKGWLGWSVWRGHELLSANNSLVPHSATANLLHFLCGLHSACPFSEVMGNTGCFGQCIVVSFSPTCKCISPHVSSCASSCVSFGVSCPQASAALLSAFEHGCHEQLCSRFWGVMGYFLQQCETYGSSCEQHWAVSHFCPHRSTLQPLSPKNTASFPKANSSQKREKLW